MNKLMTNLLNLPGVIVEDYKQRGETLILVINQKGRLQIALFAVNLAIICLKIIDI